MNSKHLLTLFVFLISSTLTPAADEDKKAQVAEVKEEKSDANDKGTEKKESEKEPKIDHQKVTLASWKLLNDDKHEELK